MSDNQTGSKRSSLTAGFAVATAAFLVTGGAMGAQYAVQNHIVQKADMEQRLSVCFGNFGVTYFHNDQSFWDKSADRVGCVGVSESPMPRLASDYIEKKAEECFNKGTHTLFYGSYTLVDCEVLDEEPVEMLEASRACLKSDRDEYDRVIFYEKSGECRGFNL